MSTGFATAFSEITLVLFTTLAPSGAVAYALMSFPIIRERLSDDAHRRIDKALCIPLIVSLVGLVASATHLGNPANALYVFMGVGRSPLSNEVFSAVIFLAFTGVYWLYSFAVKPRRLLQRLLAVGACVSAIACITAIAFAYSADTIITWNTPFSPLSLWANALLGGPVLAILGLRAARWKSRGNRFGRLMLVLAVVALAACLVVHVLQGRSCCRLRTPSRPLAIWCRITRCSSASLPFSLRRESLLTRCRCSRPQCRGKGGRLPTR